MNEQKQSQPSPSPAGSGSIRYDNIFEAIKFDSPSEFKRLMEARADLTYTEESFGEESEISALECAASWGRNSMVDMILKIRKIPEELNQALYRAASSGSATVVKSLLQARANFSILDFWRRSPLHAAANVGHASVVQTLIKAKASFVDKDEGRWTPLHSAAYHGHTDVVNILLAAKGDLDLEAVGDRERDETALLLAADKGHANVVKSLLAAKAALRSPERLLFNLTQQGHASVLQVLLDAGLDVDFPLGFDGTMLHAAVKTEHVSFVRTLIRAGASLDARDGQGRAPLHLAARLGHTPIIQMLLMAITDIEARDSRQCTPLFCAVNSCRDDAVQLLIRLKASIDISCAHSGDTMLHSAIRKRPIILSNIEEERAEAKRINFDKIKVIETLLNAKATSQIKTGNFRGQTPLDLAFVQEENRIISLFQIKIGKIAVLGAMHPDKGKHSFWNKSTLSSLRDKQVFRLMFNFGFGESPALNKPEMKEEAPSPSLK